MTDDRADRQLLWQFVEQPEPSTEGDWFDIPITALLREGYDGIHIHFNRESSEPNEVRFSRDQ